MKKTQNAMVMTAVVVAAPTRFLAPTSGWFQGRRAPVAGDLLLTASVAIRDPRALAPNASDPAPGS